jgi:hypothetical protein
MKIYLTEQADLGLLDDLLRYVDCYFVLRGWYQLQRFLIVGVLGATRIFEEGDEDVYQKGFVWLADFASKAINSSIPAVTVWNQLTPNERIAIVATLRQIAVHNEKAVQAAYDQQVKQRGPNIDQTPHDLIESLWSMPRRPRHQLLELLQSESILLCLLMVYRKKYLEQRLSWWYLFVVEHDRNTVLSANANEKKQEPTPQLMSRRQYHLQSPLARSFFSQPHYDRQLMGEILDYAGDFLSLRNLKPSATHE